MRLEVVVSYDRTGKILIVNDQPVRELLEKGVKHPRLLGLLEGTVERSTKESIEELRSAFLDNGLEGFAENFWYLFAHSIVDLTLNKSGQRKRYAIM